MNINNLNRLNVIFPDLIALLLENSAIEEDLKLVLIGDSCPIVTCSGKRTGKVAKILQIKDVVQVKICGIME